MLKTQYVLLVLVLFCFSCSTELSKINPSQVKIYFFDNQADKEVYCIDALLLPNDEILVVGVGSNADNRFDTDGRLYLQKIKANGETAWHGYYTAFKGGFPSDIIKDDDGNYVMLWTKDGAFQKVKIQLGETKPSVTVSSIGNVSPFNTTSAINLVKIKRTGNKTVKDWYLVQGTASDVYNNASGSVAEKLVYTSVLDSSFNLLKFSSQDYDQSVFGELGSDDLPYVKRIGKYFNLWQKNDSTWFSTAPYKKGMALKDNGNLYPIYQDGSKWINAFNVTSSGNMSVVLTHPDNIVEVYYGNELDVKKYGQDFQSLTTETLKGWDTSSPFFITYIESINKTLVTGTSRPGQVKLRVIDQFGNTAAHDDLGQAFPYKPAKVLLINSGRTVAIIGTTVMNNSYKRVFLIKLPVSEL